MNIKPPRLKQGEEIGIIAPAGPVTRSEIQPGIDLLESFGYRAVPAPHLYDREGYLAGDDICRLGDLHSTFRNGGIKAVFCARGGYGTLRLLDKINFDLIQRNPKIILGYSDITTLLLAIYKETGLITFHGPVVRELPENGGRALKAFLELVSTDKSPTLKLDGTALREGKGSGRLLGGNLSLICHMIGTPFMPSTKGAILFIEDREEPLYRIDRMLTYLRLSGLIENLAGLVAGSFEDCGGEISINRLLLEAVSGVDIPVVCGLPVGHGLENIPVPLGVRATLDTEKMTLSIMEASVSL